MSADTESQRGDVVTVRLDPAEGQEMQKTRPAVVVQSDVGNKTSSTTIITPATGTFRGYPFEVLIEASDSPFVKDSSVRLDQIRIVSVERRIHSVASSLDDLKMDEIDDADYLGPVLAEDRYRFQTLAHGNRNAIKRVFWEIERRTIGVRLSTGSAHEGLSYSFTE